MKAAVYVFVLERTLINNGTSIVSNFTAEIYTDEPFQTTKILEKYNPGWVVVDFTSEIDREFKRKFG